MAACLLPLIQGCNTAGCSDNHSALPLMGFYDYATGQSMSLDFLDMHGVGAPGDSLLIHAGERVSQIYLPFRSDSEVSAFCLHYDYPSQDLDLPELNDTITIRYDVQPYFASSECGAMYSYRIRSCTFTRHLIDNVVIADSMITNIERERIMVYFRTATPGEEEETL